MQADFSTYISIGCGGCNLFTRTFEPKQSSKLQIHLCFPGPTSLYACRRTKHHAHHITTQAANHLPVQRAKRTRQEKSNKKERTHVHVKKEGFLENFAGSESANSNSLSFEVETNKCTHITHFKIQPNPQNIHRVYLFVCLFCSPVVIHNLRAQMQSKININSWSYFV